MNPSEIASELTRISGASDQMASIASQPVLSRPSYDLTDDELAAARVFVADLQDINNHLLESLGKLSKHIREVKKSFFLYRPGETSESVSEGMNRFVESNTR